MRYIFYEGVYDKIEDGEQDHRESGSKSGLDNFDGFNLNFIDQLIIDLGS